MQEAALLAGLGALTAGVGVLGGLGGAILLVPALVLLGWTPSEAAPVGLLAVAAGSVAAGPRQLAERSVNHRIGAVTELAATSGAMVGALVSDVFPEDLLILLLAAAALTAAFVGLRRSGLRNPPVPGYRPADVGERVGSLAGAYPVDGGVAPYGARRLPGGLALMGLAGFVAGTTGTSGGFIKTPVMAEMMHIPTRVAASTTTFTVGVTAAAALVVFAFQGRIDPRGGAAVIFGSLAGGVAGAVAQSRLPSRWVRRSLSAILVIIAILLVAAR